jgi:hypothetical protein
MKNPPSQICGTLCDIFEQIDAELKLNKGRTISASYVSNGRDGIGVEIYRNDELLVEIFRDGTQKSRIVTLWKQDLPLELIEESIQTFRKEIPWDFIDYNKFID